MMLIICDACPPETPYRAGTDHLDGWYTVTMQPMYTDAGEGDKFHICPRCASAVRSALQGMEPDMLRTEILTTLLADLQRARVSLPVSPHDRYGASPTLLAYQDEVDRAVKTAESALADVPDTQAGCE